MFNDGHDANFVTSSAWAAFGIMVFVLFIDGYGKLCGMVMRLADWFLSCASLMSGALVVEQRTRFLTRHRLGSASAALGTQLGRPA